MNRNQRLGLIVAVVVIAVVAFVIAKPGDDDSTTGNQAGGGNSQTTTTAGGGDTTNTGPSKPPAPEVTRIAIKGNGVQGGMKTIQVKKGEQVRIVVTVDKPHTLHLHGFNIEKEAAPGKPARFAFKANIEGEFELESHTWEDAGLEAGVAKVRVEPA
jgi:FtsP/CotA-like multicopper oxidase with cupredoxin domain